MAHSCSQSFGISASSVIPPATSLISFPFSELRPPVVIWSSTETPPACTVSCMCLTRCACDARALVLPISPFFAFSPKTPLVMGYPFTYLVLLTQAPCCSIFSWCGFGCFFSRPTVQLMLSLLRYNPRTLPANFSAQGRDMLSQIWVTHG